DDDYVRRARRRRGLLRFFRHTLSRLRCGPPAAGSFHLLETRPDLCGDSAPRDLDRHNRRQSLGVSKGPHTQESVVEGFSVMPLAYGGCGGTEDAVAHENSEQGANQRRSDFMSDLFLWAS